MVRSLVVVVALCISVMQGAAALDTLDAETPRDEGSRRSDHWEPLSWCWLGFDHPDSCTSGEHYKFDGTRLTFIAGYPVGRATQQLVWSQGTYTFSCVGLAEGVLGSCTSGGTWPPLGTTYTHNCWTDPGTVGVVGCAIIQP